MKNVIVTGGSRGLGLAIAKTLASAGFNVVAVARQETNALLEAIDHAASLSYGALAFQAFDLSELPAIPQFVKRLRSDVGPIYGLVNNAGQGTSGLLATMRSDALEALIQLNILSPITLTKYVARSMMTGQGGRIVNLSSVVAKTGYSGLSAYSATKAALEGFTRSLARELGPLNITVNAVAPGFINTDMTHDLTADQRDAISRRSALKRMAEADDVANAVSFLFSEQARNITGTVMTVDAGNTV